MLGSHLQYYLCRFLGLKLEPAWSVLFMCISNRSPNIIFRVNRNSSCFVWVQLYCVVVNVYLEQRVILNLQSDNVPLIVKLILCLHLRCFVKLN